jgi:hypothetical protein
MLKHDVEKCYNELKEHMVSGRRSIHGPDEKFTATVMRNPEGKIL